MNNLERRLYNIDAFLNDIEGKYQELGRSLNDLRREINMLKQEAHIMATARPNAPRVIKNASPNAYTQPHGFNAFTTDQLVNATKAKHEPNANFVFNQAFAQLTANIAAETPSKPKTPQNVKEFNPPKIASFDKAPSKVQTNGGGGITAEFQDLVGMSGLSAKQARDNFVKKYGIIGVSCANIDERLQNINAVPVFKADDEPNKSQLWLVSAKNKYLAFINPVGGYSLDLHLFAGFKEIFRSNYKEGTYTAFKSFKPAAFIRTGRIFKCETFGEIMF